MVTGQPEAERPETIDSSCEERAGKRANPSSAQNEAAKGSKVCINNHKIMEGIELPEMRLIQTDSKGGINACCSSELS